MPRNQIGFVGAGRAGVAAWTFGLGLFFLLTLFVNAVMAITQGKDDEIGSENHFIAKFCSVPLCALKDIVVFCPSPEINPTEVGSGHVHRWLDDIDWRGITCCSRPDEGSLIFGGLVFGSVRTEIREVPAIWHFPRKEFPVYTTDHLAGWSSSAILPFQHYSPNCLLLMQFVIGDENKCATALNIGAESFFERVVSFFQSEPLFFESFPLQKTDDGYAEGKGDKKNLSDAISIAESYFPSLDKGLFAIGLLFGLIAVVCVAVPHWFWLPAYIIGLVLVGVSCTLAPTDRRSEDVRVLPVVVTELEFRDIQRHVFGAHLVERAHHAALEDRPEAFDCLSVDRADDVLALGVVNGRVRIFLIEPPVTFPLIGAEQTYFVRDGLADEFTECVGADVLDNAGDHVVLPLDRADDGRLARPNAASPAALATFVFVFVLRESADESFVHFDNAAKLVNVLHERNADLVTHHPCSFERTKAHIAPKLARADAFLGRQHEMDHAEPVSKRLIRVFEDCPGDDRKPIAGRTARGALGALPVPFTRRQIIDRWIATARAIDAFGPSTGLQIGFAGVLIGKHPLELRDGQLMDLLGLLGAGHDGSPSDDRRILPHA